MADIQWQDLPSLRGVKLSAGAKATISVATRKGGAAITPTLRVTLAKGLLTQLGWEKPTRLRIRVAAAERMVRLDEASADDAASRSLTWKDACAGITFAWAGLEAAECSAALAPHEIDGRGLVLRLPDASALAARPAARPAPSPAPAAASPARPTAPPPKPSPEQDKADAIKMLEAGLSARAVADDMGLPLATVSNWAAEVRVRAQRAAGQQRAA